MSAWLTILTASEEILLSLLMSLKNGTMPLFKIVEAATQSENFWTWNGLVDLFLYCSIPVLALIFILFYINKKGRAAKAMYEKTASDYSIFDLAKTAYEPGHKEAVMHLVEKLHYDVNFAMPSNGLTLFLCACLSGQRDLINYLLKKGADATLTTKEGDSALYLATFGVLNTPRPNTGILEDLIKAGCCINTSNLRGYTPLHRAASKGDLSVIRTLLRYGADPYLASASGVYPIDSAINAGNLEAAELLKINIANPHVWDVVDPHTPSRIKLGLQSPLRKHLLESSKPKTFQKVF
ncbi:hypothetical protein CHS0354_002671 [Potamilus streckersoni]|uniref:Uncharacterized protein n=1 Tax=Potamilus streckersoni TaxID=2493646 RepID=A0AAE0VKV8_9BIVA|nr:hypothetical protein CHS0354_002671 [Potamilus streckersoni]